MPVSHLDHYAEQFRDVVENFGFELTVEVSSNTPRDGRTGDHAQYRVNVTPGAGAGVEPVSFTFSGEIERPLVAAALRLAADRLDDLG